MTKKHADHFVHDGYHRAREANDTPIRMEIEREYAERLKAASFFERWRLRREMKREIQRRLDVVAPPWGLYFSS